ISVRWKLALITTIVTSVTLLFAGGFLAAYDMMSDRQEEAAIGTAFAKVLGGSLVLAGLHKDSPEAQEFLNALTTETRINAVGGYDAAGKRILQYYRPGIPKVAV